MEDVYGYICFYKNKECQLYAKNAYAAQQEAAKIFKAKKSYEVSVRLAEKNGEQVIQTIDF